MTTKMTQTLAHLENLVYAESFSESEDMRDRINRVAKTTLCWYEYHVYQRLLLTKPCDSTYMQLIYHLIPEIIKDDDEVEKRAMLLFGENFETEEECLFTQELHDEVYNDLLDGGCTYCSCFGEDQREEEEEEEEEEDDEYPYDGNLVSDSD